MNTTNSQTLELSEELTSQKQENPGKVVLRVKGLYKKFCRNLKKSMIYGMTDLAKGFVGIPPKTEELRKDEFWALQDINFELRENEILGIIGANGSGKSTLLRVLTGIFPPDKGSVWIDGKVGGIIALGAGMHPHMTGRENIYLNGTILGMTKEEIDAKFDEIVEFAELGDFLEAPLSTYSSGMKVRLGFAVAVHCQPEILLVDEVLAVGDLSFQNKSMAKLQELRNSAKAIIFISHNLDHIQTICTKAILLNDGKLIASGSSPEIVRKYERVTLEKKEKQHNSVDAKIQIDESYEINLITAPKIAENLEPGEQFPFSILVNSFKEYDDIQLTFGIISEISSTPILYFRSSDFGKKYKLIKGENELKFKINSLNLQEGNFRYNFALRRESTGETILRYFASDFITVRSLSENRSRGIVDFKISF